MEQEIPGLPGQNLALEGQRCGAVTVRELRYAPPVLHMGFGTKIHNVL